MFKLLERNLQLKDDNFYYLNENTGYKKFSVNIIQMINFFLFGYKNLLDK